MFTILDFGRPHAPRCAGRRVATVYYSTAAAVYYSTLAVRVRLAVPAAVHLSVISSDLGRNPKSPF